MTQLSKVAPEMVACISEGRQATSDEIARLVDRLSLEIGAAPAMTWGNPGADTSAMLVQRVARIALHGNGPRAESAR